MRIVFVTGAWLVLAAVTTAASAIELTREETLRIRSKEIASCAPGDIARWPDGQDRPAILRPMRFSIDPKAAPTDLGDALDLAAVARAVRLAAQAWAACGVGGEVLPWQPGMEKRPDVIRVVWSDSTSNGIFGLADAGKRTLTLGAAGFRLLRQRNPAHDAGQTLQLVLAHEMGHLYGLTAHSRHCVDVTSYYSNERGEQCYSAAWEGRRFLAEFRHNLPTACDIARCRQANGLPTAPTTPR